MNPQEKLIHQFYTSFQNKDAEGMVACYHSDIVFKDPGFGELKGEEAKNMWRMLLSRAQDLKIEYKDVKIEGETGKAHWEAYYTFTKTGRKVHNIIDASFRFRDGKIIAHEDVFDFWRWSRQALGIAGMLFGFTNFFQNKVQSQTRSMLKKYVEKTKNKGGI
ncbi:MAG: nuclear transport factor 2 family protein [Flammeovirgaceae bacterium]